MYIQNERSELIKNININLLLIRCLANGSYPPVKHRIEFQYNNKNSLFSGKHIIINKDDYVK